MYVLGAFCIVLEEFNNKLLKPELTKQQLEILHVEASKLYENYFSKNSSDFIGCPASISDKLKELLTEGIYNVAKLRTSEPLFEAFDYTFVVLEKDWLPIFYHSNEVDLLRVCVWCTKKSVFMFSFTALSVGLKLLLVTPKQQEQSKLIWFVCVRYLK